MGLEQFMPKPKKFTDPDFGEYYLKPLSVGQTMKIRYAGDEDKQVYTVIASTLCDKDGNLLCESKEDAMEIDIAFLKPLTESIQTFNGMKVDFSGVIDKDPL